MRKIKIIVMPIALLICVTVGLNALNNESLGNSAQTAAEPMDQKFILEAALGNLAEIRMGQLAKQRAAGAEVKDFAQMMINDHTKANSELAQIAQRMGAPLPKELDPFHRAAAAGMSRLSGAEFDKAYIKGRLGGHALTLDLIEMQEKSGKDPELRQYAARTRPVIERHYELAQRLDDGMRAMAIEAGE